jgi:hypothetical protein
VNRTLFVGGEDFALQTDLDPVASGTAVDFQDPSSALDFLGRLLADPHGLDTLRDVAASDPRGRDLDDHEVLELLARRLSERSLRLIQLPPTVLGAVGDAAEIEPTAREPEAEAREEKTWIRIVLVDNGNPRRPVPFKRYRIELPDGSVREGMLDENGAATLTGIDPGDCEVSFPEFDAAEWRPL